MLVYDSNGSKMYRLERTFGTFLWRLALHLFLSLNRDHLLHCIYSHVPVDPSTSYFPPDLRLTPFQELTPLQYVTCTHSVNSCPP